MAAFADHALRALAARDDVDVAAFALTWRGRRSLVAALPAGVHAFGRAVPARAVRAAWRRLDQPTFERFAGPVDVVHGTNFVVPPTRRAAEVVTVHDLTPVRFPELCTRDTLAYPALVRRALRRGAWVHTPSAFVAREVVELLGADAGRVVAVASGVPAGPADASGRGALASGPADASGRGALAGLGSWPYVLALGTIEPRKDLPALVRAFDAIADDHRDLRLVVAGADGWGSTPFDEAVARAAHRDRVVRLGYVTDAARGALLAGARVFAFPSRYEGFGFPPLEAMAAGVPVVATAAGALPEVLGDAAALVSPGDDDALASGLAVVLDDDARRDRLVRAGMARAAHYSWTSCAAGLVELYRRAVCERGG